MSAINPITADPNFSQGIKGNKYWAIRQYDKCSGNTNNPNSGWDHKFIIDYDKAFEFRGDLYRGSSSYAEQSWTAIMQGKTPWGTASTATSCEITRKATDSTFSTLTGSYFPKLASNHWYVQATMAWFTDLKPSTSTVKARGLVNLWFKDKINTNQHLVMDLAMINLKKGTGTNWIGQTFTVGKSYYGPDQGVPYQVTTSGTTKTAHYNIVITSNPSSGAWKSTGALDIDSYVNAAITYDWAGKNPGKGWITNSNRSQWELWDAELGVEIDDNSYNTIGQIGRCRMATKYFQVLYS